MKTSERPVAAPLRGIIIRDEGTDLVVRANAADVAAYAVGQEVALHQAGPVTDLYGQTLYDQHGNAVALVTEVNVRQDFADMTAFGDATPQYLHVRRRVEIRAVGLRAGLPWPA